MIVKETLSEQIYEQLRDDFFKKNIKFGDKLVNKDLQKRFSVSSTPVRDAINKLKASGLVESTTNVGATVITPDYEYFCEVNEYIKYMQVTALNLSFQKADKQQVVNEAGKCIEMQKKHINDDNYFYYDTKFHKTFVDFSYNSFLKSSFKRNVTLQELLVREYFESYSEFSEAQERLIKDHENILRAYDEGDVNKACELMLGHFDKGERYFRKTELNNVNVNS